MTAYGTSWESQYRNFRIQLRFSNTPFRNKPRHINLRSIGSMLVLNQDGYHEILPLFMVLFLHRHMHLCPLPGCEAISALSLVLPVRASVSLLEHFECSRCETSSLKYFAPIPFVTFLRTYLYSRIMAQPPPCVHTVLVFPTVTH